MRWIHLVERHHAPLSMNIFQKGHSRDTFKKILHIDFGFDNFINVEGDVYLGEDVQDALTLLLKRINIDDIAFLINFKRKCYKHMSALVKTAQGIKNKKFRDLPNKELYRLFNKFVQKYEDAGCFIAIFPEIGKRLEEVLEKQCREKNISKEQIYAFTVPKKENEGTKERINLLRIAQIKDKALFQKRIKKHLDEYAWLGTRWMLGKPTSKKELMERLEHLSMGNNKEELKQLREKKTQEIHKTKHLFLGLDKKTKMFVKIAQEYVYLRTYRTDMVNKAIGQLYSFFCEVGKRLDLSYEEVVLLVPEEIYQGLHGKKINKKVIRERQKGVASLYINNKYMLLTGSALSHFKEKEGLAKKKIEESEIKGIVAYKGRVKGTVKVVLSMEDIKKIKKGEILVAVMTFPAYIPAMEKAAAFITDEGGILCHAAIVARELQKPCIIGTKIATKTLKDGDSIDVDAEKGIVRKINI